MFRFTCRDPKTILRTANVLMYYPMTSRMRTHPRLTFPQRHIDQIWRCSAKQQFSRKEVLHDIQQLTPLDRWRLCNLKPNLSFFCGPLNNVATASNHVMDDDHGYSCRSHFATERNRRPSSAIVKPTSVAGQKCDPESRIGRNHWPSSETVKEMNGADQR